MSQSVNRLPELSGARIVGATVTTQRLPETTVLDSEVRPWGSWHVIDVNAGYKIKRIHVTPGCRLSLQTHEHRSEHWVVIQGTATTTVDGVVSLVEQGQSLDVAQGAAHRLANDGDVELVIVEVQLGHYTGEDDIVRLEDDYGRCEH
jgi:mannose-6-phosphate isomerase-like protein (cupin superfamily)